MKSTGNLDKEMEFSLLGCVRGADECAEQKAEALIVVGKRVSMYRVLDKRFQVRRKIRTLCDGVTPPGSKE